MLIGELAQQGQCSRDTIRYYEKKGLLQVPKGTRRENNYKEYPAACLNDLQLIRSMTSLGFTLRETKEFLGTLRDQQTPACDLGDSLTLKIAAIDQQVSKLLALKSHLLQVQSQCGSDCQVSDGQLGCAPAKSSGH